MRRVTISRRMVVVALLMMGMLVWLLYPTCESYCLDGDKWVVVTCDAHPCDVTMADIPGWRLLIVTSSGAESGYIPLLCPSARSRHPNAEYFTASSVRHLITARLTSDVSSDVIMRKNLAYLYAIGQGAEVIFDTEDGVRLNRQFQDFHPANDVTPVTGLMFMGTKLFNPYIHYGQPTLWPRGFPLDAVGGEQNPWYRVGAAWSPPLIQQGIITGSADVDLTLGQPCADINVAFDPAAPPVLLPPGVFSPLNSRCTMFHKMALWALPLPATTSLGMSDVWRGYWAQRLLWEIGGHVGFVFPNVYQTVSESCRLRNKTLDFKAEESFELQTNLLDFLSAWTCPSDLTFFQCAVRLSADMALQGWWGSDDVKLVRDWLDDLTLMGYIEPDRVVITKSPASAIGAAADLGMTLSDRVAIRWWDDIRAGSLARFVAVTQKAPRVVSYQSKSSEIWRWLTSIFHFRLM